MQLSSLHSIEARREQKKGKSRPNPSLLLRYEPVASKFYVRGLLLF